MEFMGNREFWDDKFASRSDKPLSPEASLIENINYLKKDTVLELACGDGRNTLFLLSSGFKVTGVDFSSKALERLKNFANRNTYTVDTKQMDLSQDNALKDIGVFDNILISHYKLSEDNVLSLKDHLTAGGILYICSFGHKHKVDSKVRNEDLIYPSDFENIKEFFELIEYSESEDDRGFFVTYIFQKNK